MKKIKLKSLFTLTLFAGTLLQINAQDFYIKKHWEKESVLLSGEQNHARTLLDQNNNVLTVTNKMNSSSANIFSNKINSSGIQTWQTEIANFLNVIGTKNHGTDIKKDAQGNIYICGANYNGLNYDYLIVKYNSSGSELWRRTYNGTGNSDDAPSSLVLDASGNVYVTGASFGLNTMTDFATLKINGQTGAIIWTSRYDFNNKYDGATQVKIDNQGNVLVCGSSANNLDNADFVAIKYNQSNGNQLQQKRHNTPQNGFDFAIGMQIDASDNVYVVGTSNSNLTNKDIKIIAYNSNLQIIWVKYIDESGLEDDVTGIVKNAYEDLIITGSTKNLQNEINLLTAKISKVNGNIIWKKIEENQNDVTSAVGKGLGTDLNGNIVVVSEIMQNNVSFIKALAYDPTGVKKWEYINENIAMTNQKALDILVKGSEVILTGTKESTSGETLITVKLEPKEVVIAPDFNGETFLPSLGLETNVGQLQKTNFVDPAPEVKYFNEHMNPAVFMTESNFSLAFHQSQSNDNIGVDRIDMDFLGSNPTKTIMSLKHDELPGVKNYYLPHHEEGYLGITEYSRVIMGDVYPNVDVQYYSGLNGMKYYISVRPGGDPQNVRLQFTGANHLTLNNDGSLEVHSAYGFITFNKSIAYQLDANNQPVELVGQGEYIQISSNVVIFNIKEFDHSKPLFVQMGQKGDLVPHDKTDNMLWCTYYGGPRYDEFKDITTDESGNVYFVGATYGLGFPQAGQNIVGAALSHRIVCGAHQSLGRKIWSTIYGAKYDIGEAIATDRFGNVFITGMSAGLGSPNNFIDVIQDGAENMSPMPSPFIGAQSYAFVTKFSQVNGTISWSSLIGDHDNNAFYQGKSIACDNNGRIYIAGRAKRITELTDVSNGSRYFDGTTNVQKGFITVFNQDSDLIWSTMFGNEGVTINDIAIGPASDFRALYLTGTGTTATPSDVLPYNPFNTSDYSELFGGGESDAFVAKFDFYGNIVWSSFIGGVGDEEGNGIAVANNGDVTVVGSARVSSVAFDFLEVPGAYFSDELSDPDYTDAFLTVFEPSPNYAIKYSTYFGDLGTDVFNDVDYSAYGNLYAVGTMGSTTGQKYMPGAYNQYLLENISPSGGTHTNAVLFTTNADYWDIWSTLVGGSPNPDYYTIIDNDLGNSISVYQDEYFYIAGRTNSQTNFPVSPSTDPLAYYQSHNGCYNSTQADMDEYSDGFIAQFSLIGTWLGTEEIENDENADLLIFPNPTNGKITIFGKNEQFFLSVENLEVMDLSGKVVKSIDVSQNSIQSKLEVDISDLPNGFYNLIVSSKQESRTFKLIKQ